MTTSSEESNLNSMNSSIRRYRRSYGCIHVNHHLLNYIRRLATKQFGLKKLCIFLAKEIVFSLCFEVIFKYSIITVHHKWKLKIKMVLGTGFEPVLILRSIDSNSIALPKPFSVCRSFISRNGCFYQTLLPEHLTTRH